MFLKPLGGFTTEEKVFRYEFRKTSLQWLILQTDSKTCEGSKLSPRIPSKKFILGEYLEFSHVFEAVWGVGR